MEIKQYKWDLYLKNVFNSSKMNCSNNDFFKLTDSSASKNGIFRWTYGKNICLAFVNLTMSTKKFGA